MQPLDWALLPFTRYFDFTGRSSRAEYWYYTALTTLVSLIVVLMGMMLPYGSEAMVSALNTVVGLATLIPSLAVAVRRLHDINRSGLVLLKYITAFVILMVLMPLRMFFGMVATGLVTLAIIAVGIKFLLLMVTEGDRGPNTYGHNPYGLTYGY